MAEKPRVFLSYSHKDKDIVERVALLMKEHNIDVWYDEWKLKVGSSLIREIQEGIRKADFVVAFFSENAMASPWVQEEYEASKVQQIETREKVIILPARLDNCELPQFMKCRVYADFRHSFVVGFTRLLEAILGTQGMNPIDKAFAKYSKLLDIKGEHKQAEFLAKFSCDELLGKILHLLYQRWYTTRCSVEAAAGVARESEENERYYRTKDNSYYEAYLYHFEKWLGNTIRDYLEFKIYWESFKLLTQQKELASKQSLTLFSLLLDHLYTQLNSAIRYFGMPSFRGAESSIVHDLDMVFSSLAPENSVS